MLAILIGYIKMSTYVAPKRILLSSILLVIYYITFLLHLKGFCDSVDFIGYSRAQLLKLSHAIWD